MIRVLAAFAALSIVLTACGGGDDDPRPTATIGVVNTPLPEDSPEPTAPPGPRVPAAEALGPAAEKWAAAETLRIQFFATAALGSRSLTFSGTTQHRAPDVSLTDADYFGRQLEMLTYGANSYINVSGQGWKKVDFDTIGVDLTQLSAVGEHRGFFDLQELVAAFDDVEQLPDNEIEGVAYTRYRADAELSRIADQLPGLVSPEVLDELEPYIEGLQFDFWIAKDTGLPRRLVFVVNTPGTSDAGSGGLEMTADYEEYGAAVEIPPEPVGAPALERSDLGG